MALTSLSLRKALLLALGSAAVAACGSSTDASSSGGSSVDAAYGALVSDAAKCADTVSTCLEAAGTDQTAWVNCRDDFKACRDNAGTRAEQRLVAAVTTCTSKHRECAQAATGDSNRSCRTQLVQCLSSAHKAGADDADAGEDSDKGGDRKHDCMDDLQSCVDGDMKPGDCAHAARQCVVQSLPDVDVVAPMRKPDGGDKAGDHHAEAGSGGGRDSGDRKGAASDAGVADGSGSSSGSEREARMCVKTFAGCVEAKSEARTCASQLRECTQGVQP